MVQVKKFYNIGESRQNAANDRSILVPIIKAYYLVLIIKPANHWEAKLRCTKLCYAMLYYTILYYTML